MTSIALEESAITMKKPSSHKMLESCSKNKVLAAIRPPPPRKEKGGVFPLLEAPGVDMEGSSPTGSFMTTYYDHPLPHKTQRPPAPHKGRRPQPHNTPPPPRLVVPTLPRTVSGGRSFRDESPPPDTMLGSVADSAHRGGWSQRVSPESSMSQRQLFS